MFAARCLCVSLAVFVLLYISLSLAVACSVRFLAHFRPRRLPANLLFAWRMFPLAAASLVTLIFTLPSFLWLEPRSTDEAVGLAPAILGSLCLAVLMVGCARAMSAQRRSTRALSDWLNGSTACDSIGSVPVFRSGNFAPPLAGAGVLDPKVLLSESAAAALTAAELRTALRHEVAHARTYDNLRKLLFRFAAFPGMSKLEDAWREAAELRADDAAALNVADAMDLASALLKISRLLPHQPVAAELTTPLLHSATAFELRLQRLVAWEDTQPDQSRFAPYLAYALPALLLAALCFASTYNAALLGMHAFTELLVR